ncbi:MAG TPA: SCO5389 family protein [Actinocrinis sp.]|uniref:SCO5389 family protein n=1 Tax=Actinocrinis sp. TaxID=1920516 RepID=UPI002D3FAB8F|nr:SCO5389 family protein [Actinocrinis sp.]HZU56780.1 SCO5389 family protein [Actinocrinis sp.]
MSLDVSPELLAQAQAGPVDPAAFLDTVRTSLPYAYDLIASLTKDLEACGDERPFADNLTPPPSEAERGQLLRALASDAIRGSLEEHFGVRLAFQNCHRVAVFRPAAQQSETYRDFTSQRSQLLNQSPELRDC